MFGSTWELCLGLLLHSNVRASRRVPFALHVPMSSERPPELAERLRQHNLSPACVAGCIRRQARAGMIAPRFVERDPSEVQTSAPTLSGSGKAPVISRE